GRVLHETRDRATGLECGVSPVKPEATRPIMRSPFAGLFDIVKCECGGRDQDVAGSSAARGVPGMDSTCRPLDRLRALVLADARFQEGLRAPDDAAQFVTLVLDAARDLGLSLAAEGVRAAMRPRLPGMDALVDDEVGETALPPAGWLPVGTAW